MCVVYKNKIGIAMLVFLMVLNAYPAGFQSGFAGKQAKNEAGKKLRSDIEYLLPTNNSRNIKTINFNAYMLLSEIKELDISFLAGLTTTFATGDIIQLEGEIDKGNLRRVYYENTAVGIGPGLLMDADLLEIGNFSLHLNGSAFLIFYNRDFPAGGDIYNFMWRAGPVVEYILNDKQKIGFSYILVHISNGQGYRPKNPSYDAKGIGLFFSSSL